MSRPSRASRTLRLALDAVSGAEADPLETRSIVTAAGRHEIALETGYWRSVDDLAREHAITPDELCRWVLEEMSAPADLLRVYVLASYGIRC